ncbi:MAG: glycoside hydrolase family protein [Bacteroidota bacterium]
MLQPVPEYSVLEHDDFWVWGASMIRTKDGTCHLFYSRWSKEFEFKDWITQSEIAYATAEQPGGPYAFKRTILKGDSFGFRNRDVGHNPHIKKFGDKYYLYFISLNVKDLGLGERKNHLAGQRIGVAVADSPEGPWKALDTPIIDLQEGKPAHGYVTNPSVCERPDGTWLMLFKSRTENWTEEIKFKSIHCLATAPTPTGPFTISNEPILTESTAEDPFLWYQNGRYYAIVDDEYGNYIGERGLTLFESVDGFEWGPSENALVSKVQINWENDSVTPLRHLERAQLWFDKDGNPAMLFCAAQVKNKNGKLHSFNVHIPLEKK